MSLANTPSANRLHIALFGRRNSGKSSLMNALTGQQAALVSSFAGTTTDPVYKAMELPAVGPVLFLDTAGFDDEGELGLLRVQKTQEAVFKTDLALLVLSGDELQLEKEWVDALQARAIPVIAVLNKTDALPASAALLAQIKATLHLDALPVSALTGAGIARLREEIARRAPLSFENNSIAGSLVKEEDVVLLVMPQDLAAPKGRLILPQVQTIRDLLEHKCVVLCVTANKLEHALAALKAPPTLIITDSQCFAAVYAAKPPQSALTSFSVLFAAYKGDLQEFIRGANAIDLLNAQSRVLIAEACTHAPLSEDIGRVKIPALLRRRFGESLQIDFVSGVDFPQDLRAYNLIIHCGACMFNRSYVLSRIERAKEQHVAMTNYGVALAKLGGILDKLTFPAF